MQTLVAALIPNKKCRILFNYQRFVELHKHTRLASRTKHLLKLKVLSSNPSKLSFRMAFSCFRQLSLTIFIYFQILSSDGDGVGY